MAAIRWQQFEKDGQLYVEEIHKVVVYRFDLADVEDPDLYAAEPLIKWEHSEQGQFVMTHAVNKPEWRRHMDPMFMGYRYVITAELTMKKLAEFYLRWGKDGSNPIQ